MHRKPPYLHSHLCEWRHKPVEGAIHQVSGSLLRRSNLRAQGQTLCIQDPGFLT